MNDRRDGRLSLRVDDHEGDVICRAALANHQSVGAFLRKAAMDQAHAVLTNDDKGRAYAAARKPRKKPA